METLALHIGHINLARKFGGGEQQTLNLMKELAASKIQQTLVCHSPGRLSNAALESGISVQYVKHWLRGHHQRQDVDIWHAHDGKAVHWAALHHLIYRKPYIITRRVDNPIKSNFYTKYSYCSAEYVVCLSNAIEARVMELDLRTNRTIIPSSFSTFPVHPKESSTIRKKYCGKFIIGQVGALLKHKGQHITVEAAQKLAGEMPWLKFLLLGDGPERKPLEKAIRRTPSVSLLGHKERIGPFYAAFDLFVFPSITEGLGSSILEAMQAKIPVLATTAGGIPDIIDHGVNGWLVRPNDPDELAEAISYLYHHPDIRLQLAQHAYNNLDRFSPKTLAKRYIELYSSSLTHRESQQQ